MGELQESLSASSYRRCSETARRRLDILLIIVVLCAAYKFPYLLTELLSYSLTYLLTQKVESRTIKLFVSFGITGRKQSKNGMLYRKLVDNNNLSLIIVKINRSTLHTVYMIQQSATQGSNDTTHSLPRRTAATTRGVGCQKQTATRLPTIRSGGSLPRKASIHQMAPRKRGRTHLIIALLFDDTILMQRRAESLCTRQNEIKTEVSDTNERLARFVVVSSLSLLLLLLTMMTTMLLIMIIIFKKNKIARYFDLVIFHHLEVEKCYSDLPAS